MAFWTDWSSQLTVHDHDPLAARSLLVLRHAAACNGLESTVRQAVAALAGLEAETNR